VGAETRRVRRAVMWARGGACTAALPVLLCLVKRRQILGVENLPSDISPVIDSLEHALLARHPRPRYVVGRDAVTMAVLAMLPEIVGDWVLERRLQLSSRLVHRP